MAVFSIDCKTVSIFAYSSTREQSNKRSGTKLKTESETGERRYFLSPHTPYGRVRLARFTRVRLLRHALPISLLILRKKSTVLKSSFSIKPKGQQMDSSSLVLCLLNAFLSYITIMLNIATTLIVVKKI